MKPAWPAEPTFSILMLPMGGGGREHHRHMYYNLKQGIFSFADMFPVRLTISIYTIEQCNKISSLRKNQNETIGLTIRRTEFRENISFENNLARRAPTTTW